MPDFSANGEEAGLAKEEGARGRGVGEHVIRKQASHVTTGPCKSLCTL